MSKSNPALPYAIEFDKVTFGYRKRQPILHDLSLTIPQGSLVTILGESGGGKTTLLKLAKGLCSPQAGDIRILGQHVPRLGPRSRLAPEVAYIPQQLGLIRGRSVIDNVLVGTLAEVPAWRSLSGIFPAAKVEAARDLMERLGIGAKSFEKVRFLSGGERQRVAIARALIQQPSIILADEFVSQLDAVTTREIMEYVHGIVEAGVTVLMTSHEVELVEEFADHVVVVRDGRKVVDCAASELNASSLAGMIKA